MPEGEPPLDPDDQVEEGKAEQVKIEDQREHAGVLSWEVETRISSP